MRSRFLIQKKGKLIKKEKSSGRAIGRNLCGSLDVESHTNAQLTARSNFGDFCAFLCAKGDKITESGGAVGYMFNWY